MKLENCPALTLALSPRERGQAYSTLKKVTEW